MTELHAIQVEINGKLERMMDGIETLKERSEEMALDIGKIKEAVYHPDEGLYARLRELEQWKSNASRVIWILITGMVGLFFAALKQHVF
jgi:hypothetical protein|tara:strand:+ start:621 stop:887 length:267 start_codon:yes stop_codon:yes gene_type:complete